MKAYYRVMLGKGSAFAAQGFAGGPLNEGSGENLRAGTFSQQAELKTVEDGVSAGAEADFLGLRLREHGAEGFGIEYGGFIGFRHAGLEGGASRGEGIVGNRGNVAGDRCGQGAIDIPVAVGRFGFGTRRNGVK